MGGNMQYHEAINYPFSYDQIDEIAYLTHKLFLNYIDNYSSSKPLSKEWVARKKNNEYWKGIGYNSGNGAFTEFKIKPRSAPNGAFYIGWFDFDVPPHFKYASSRYNERMLLPSGEASFNKTGEVTGAFCDFITHLAYEAVIEYGYL